MLPLRTGSLLCDYLLRLSALSILLCVAVAIRRIYFHPLSAYPGPKLWAATRVPYVVSLLRGTLNERMLELHEKYGDVVRLAPDELSYACEEAWRDIYMHRPGHKEVVKDDVWYFAPNGMPQNIVTTTSTQVRARMRRLLAPSFSEQSLRAQGPVLEHYAALLMDRLKNLHATRTPPPTDQKHVVVNLTDWLNFYTMDIIGDLAIGSSFHCLDTTAYHPWVRTLYMFYKGMIYAAAARFFPVTSFLLEYCIPAKILAMQRQHTEFTNEKILQRLELEDTLEKGGEAGKGAGRPDLVTPFIKAMRTSPEKMSLAEIQSTFAVILVAGSETTATTLLGVFYKLATHQGVQDKLYQTLRERFEYESQIDVETTRELVYLDAVISEALRLCYAIPGGLPRVVPRGGEIYGGRWLPGGTKLSIRPHVIFHSPTCFYWPWEFVPERWLPVSQRPKEHANDRLSACQPFSVGPTNCIGKALAWAEMRVVVAKLVWGFEVSMTERGDGDEFCWEKQHMMMLVEKGDLWVGLRRRKGEEMG
ncbi:putative RNA polymerase II mediator complex component Srb8 [Lophiostoma macrostomum CBS 122681]|uniref:Putative RNA polymerase II mediator complex component Srb8 n=1 Tax=Lophiostoma macrostomum CBS 122681 TaxID=1314788 RepID=A0A6A6TLW8_9PLEO|nr:putative RNA polymerase II mediator complex component Srb8 [Lophiostoma macrostomum CBS 122681]